MVQTRSGKEVKADPAGLKDTAQTREGGALPTTPPSTPLAAPGRRRRGATATHGEPEVAGIAASSAYGLLGTMLMLAAVPCVLTPKLLVRGMFGRAADPPEDQHSHLLWLLACGLATAATLSFALGGGARKHMLSTFTADTLKAALIAFAGMNMQLQLYYPAMLTPLAAISAAGAAAATFALPASQLLGRQDWQRVWRDFRRLPRNLHYLITLRRMSAVGALYLLLTWAFPLAGLAYFVAPKYTLYHTFGYVYGKSTQMLWKAVGGGLMSVLPALTYTLKDKAENDLLGRSLGRTLNGGLLLASVGHLLVFAPILLQRHGGYLLLLLTSTWATALVAAMAGLSVPEAGAAVQQALAEGVEGAKEVAAKAAGAVGAAAEEVAGGPVGYPVDAAEVEGPVGPKEL